MGSEPSKQRPLLIISTPASMLNISVDANLGSATYLKQQISPSIRIKHYLASFASLTPLSSFQMTGKSKRKNTRQDKGGPKKKQKQAAIDLAASTDDDDDDPEQEPELSAPATSRRKAISLLASKKLLVQQ